MYVLVVKYDVCRTDTNVYLNTCLLTQVFLNTSSVFEFLMNFTINFVNKNIFSNIRIPNIFLEIHLNNLFLPFKLFKIDIHVSPMYDQN